MDDLVDYEEYARSFPQDEALVSMPEGENHDSIGPFDQTWTRDPSPIRYRLSAKPPAQPATTQKPPVSNPAIAKSTDVREPHHGGKKEVNGLQTANTAVQSAGPVNSHPAPNPNAMNPNKQTQTPIPLPLSTSLPLDRNHPNAATIPGLTPGRDRCDTCFKNHVSIHPSNFPPFPFFYIKTINSQHHLASLRPRTQRRR